MTELGHHGDDGLAKFRDQKTCKVCKQSALDPDPIHPHRTRAWMKPDFAGLICAYCGTAKLKLYSDLKSMKEVILVLETKSEKKKEFNEFIDNMICQYKEGKRHSRTSDLKQRIVKEKEVNMGSSVKGVSKLYDSYVEAFGIVSCLIVVVCC